MIYLDANALYWYYGRDKLHLPQSKPIIDIKKLCDYLDSCTNISLPVSVWIEIIVHFRNNPKVINSIISFLQEKRIKIYNNMVGYCFTPTEQAVLSIFKYDFEFKEYAYRLLDIKIDIEIRHAYVFLRTISLMYADYYLKTIPSLNEETRLNVLNNLEIILSDHMKDDALSQLTCSLNDGYKEDKPQQNLKNKYIELLVQNCLFYHIIIDAIKTNLNNEQNLYNAMCDSAKKAHENGFNDNQIMKIIVDSLSNDSAFLQEAKTQIPAKFMKNGYTKHQAEYIKTLLSAWLERGQKLRKNDIFDMFYVGSIDKQVYDCEKSIIYDQSSYLISFDTTVMNFICENDWNKMLLNRFLLTKC